MRWGRVLGVAAGVVLLAAAGGLLWARSLFWLPADVEPAEPFCSPASVELQPGQPFKVLVWNLQYAGSRKHHFFYDGGSAVSVPESDMREMLARIAEVVNAHQPDVVLFQEVDRGSRRTHGIDQHGELTARLPYACGVSTPYHRVGHVPTPPQEHLGKVDMHLSVFSRFRITGATRTQLALLDEPWWRRLFNLRRALLSVDVAMAGGGTLRLFDTHLSAFSRNDGTLDKQVAQLDEALTAAEQQGLPWVLGGDLNALAPGDDPARLGEEGTTLYGLPTPVQRLFDRHSSVFAEPRYAAEGAGLYTYLPFGADRPDRVLDYVFVGRKVSVRSAEVLRVYDVSDHLPVLVELVVE